MSNAQSVIPECFDRPARLRREPCAGRKSRTHYNRFPPKTRGNDSNSGFCKPILQHPRDRGLFPDFCSSQSGFSFLEMVMVIALIGIIAGVMAQMFVFGVDMFDATATRKDSMQGGRIAVEFMVQDLRAIADADDVTTATATSLTFYNIDSETINYSYSGGTLSRNSNTLLEGLSNFQLSYTDVDGVVLSTPVSTPGDIWKISFSIDATVDGKPFHMESSVVPRAFD